MAVCQQPRETACYMDAREYAKVDPTKENPRKRSRDSIGTMRLGHTLSSAAKSPLSSIHVTGHFDCEAAMKRAKPQFNARQIIKHKHLHKGCPICDDIRHVVFSVTTLAPKVVKTDGRRIIHVPRPLARKEQDR
jgi:hypothetical protein